MFANKFSDYINWFAAISYFENTFLNPNKCCQQTVTWVFTCRIYIPVYSFHDYNKSLKFLLIFKDLISWLN